LKILDQRYFPSRLGGWVTALDRIVAQELQKIYRKVTHIVESSNPIRRRPATPDVSFKAEKLKIA
jgi:hypothetical protein